MFHRWPLLVVSWMTPAWPTPPLRRRALAAVEQTENSYILHSDLIIFGVNINILSRTNSSYLHLKYENIRRTDYK